MICRYNCKDNGRACCYECKNENCGVRCNNPCYLVTGEEKPVFILPG